MAALHSYITQNLSAQSSEDSPPSRTKGSQVYAERLYSTQVSPFDGTFAKGKAEDFKMRKLFQPRPGPGVLRPTPEMLSHKSASQDDPKDPLSIVDEALIKNVLKDLEKHQVNVENLSSTELDEIADTIATAVQSVGIQEETEKNAGKANEDKTEAQMKKGDAQGRVELQTGLMENSVNIPDNGVHEASVRSDKEENTAKLIRFLNENALAEKMHKDLIPEEPTKTETKKSEETDSSSSEETNAGVENVKSETFSRELTTAKNSESDSKDPSQTSYWIKNALIQEENSYEKPQKNTRQGLQLEVKSSQEEEYGYIVTVKDPLSVEKGLELIKEVADLLKLQMSVFDDVNVLGPAVTFRVRSNLQNISTADVAKEAAINKEKLEKTTGLKILQTGVGETLDSPHGGEEGAPASWRAQAAASSGGHCLGEPGAFRQRLRQAGAAFEEQLWVKEAKGKEDLYSGMQSREGLLSPGGVRGAKYHLDLRLQTLWGWRRGEWLHLFVRRSLSARVQSCWEGDVVDLRCGGRQKAEE
ncbi:receptor-type tyrosine-protein phosphatase N2-like [Serinus canaria]|uniref:receptor-type tyrosine-protein phosphatase N2-like n=1 Tax=Serinus canaria TaxID=9135 RepID=UPI0021CC5761|nr:receptor-type tyrosine-protein phosphatase N2-like [Serinus canaria]